MKTRILLFVLALIAWSAFGSGCGDDEGEGISDGSLSLGDGTSSLGNGSSSLGNGTSSLGDGTLVESSRASAESSREAGSSENSSQAVAGSSSSSDPEGSSSVGISSSAGESSSSSSKAHPERYYIRFDAARLVCDVVSGPTGKAEFFGTCEVSGKHAGSPLQCYNMGYPSNGFLWETEELWASEWTLRPGEWQEFNRQRNFRVPGEELEACVFTVKARLYEKAAGNNVDFGWQEISCQGGELSSGTIWLPTFSKAGTTARIGMTLVLE